MKKITLPKWLPTNKLKKIFNLIEENQGEARMVGGCVRDILVGVQSKDIDIATTLKPSHIMEVFQKEDFHVVPTGIDYGTITLVFGDDHFEITTLRSDIECFGRKAVVKFGTDWRQDAIRRDFTMNALYMDLSGNTHDYFDGKQDLEKKLVRFIGDPNTRLREDYLRALRYFRFLSYFGVEILHQESFDAVRDAIYNLKDISGERIHQEFTKILEAKYNNQAVELMNECNVFEILMDSKTNQLPKLQHKFGFLPNFTALISCLKECDIAKIRNRLKLSNTETKFIKSAFAALDKYQDTNLDHKTICYRNGIDFYQKFTKMLEILGRDIKKKLPNDWEIPIFPIKAKDLDLEGPALGKALKELEQRWIDSEFSLLRDDLLL